jgi:addiction module HigA family antidote
MLFHTMSQLRADISRLFSYSDPELRMKGWIMPRDQIVTIEEVSHTQVETWLEAGEVLLVDVRETAEYEAEHISGAMLLPLSGLDPELFPTLSGKRVVLHCAIGKRSEAAARMLMAAGHDHVAHMAGGLKAWKEAGLETELPLDEPAASTPDRPALHPGEVLAQDYLAPRKLETRKLAEEIGVREERIARVVEGKVSVTPEMSLRLARFFSTEPDFWMQLQLTHDLQKARTSLGEALCKEVSPKAA